MAGLDDDDRGRIEAGHAENAAGYQAGLAGYRAGSVPGVRGWIVQCAAAVSRGAELSPVNPRRAGTLTR